MEAPAQPQANQPLIPQTVTLISSEGNRYTLNGPKLLQAEYFKTLLRFEQAKSKAPETVTEINIKIPNAILEPITRLINIVHASSGPTEGQIISKLIDTICNTTNINEHLVRLIIQAHTDEQIISKLMDAIRNTTNINERIINLLIQAHTFEQPLVTKSIARSIAEVITEQDVVYFRQLAPNSEHQNLHPLYQALIAHEMVPTTENAYWLLQWLIDLYKEDPITICQLTAQKKPAAGATPYNPEAAYDLAKQAKALKEALKAYQAAGGTDAELVNDAKNWIEKLNQASKNIGVSVDIQQLKIDIANTKEEMNDAFNTYYKDPSTANKEKLKKAIDALVQLIGTAQTVKDKDPNLPSIITSAKKDLTRTLKLFSKKLEKEIEIGEYGYDWIIKNQEEYNQLFA
jgi:hypothetical protein